MNRPLRSVEDRGGAHVEHLFIVRVSHSGAIPRLRGSVVHVPTQARFYFSELATLQEFIRERIRPL
ncbi:MAG TPA: hypothetical protein VGI19_03310 [Candidatus Cybelea sp.]